VVSMKIVKKITGRVMIETRDVEYKERFTDRVMEAVCAFANSAGGTLYIGISDNGEVIGVDLDKVISKLGIHPEIEIEEREGKNGRYYERVGNTTREMNLERLREFFLKGVNWDGLISEEGITVEDLKRPHSSVPRNPLIVHIFYLAGLIEEVGSGIGRMVESLRGQGMLEPEFKEEMGGFSVRFYKDIYTEENLRKMGLNKRQIKAVLCVKERGKISNKEYQENFGIKKRQATDDLKVLEEKGIFKKVGTTGKGTYYVLKMQQKGETGDKGAIAYD
jgi:predicted HTH transcriptional regulator